MSKPTIATVAAALREIRQRIEAAEQHLDVIECVRRNANPELLTRQIIAVKDLTGVAERDLGDLRAILAESLLRDYPLREAKP